MEIIQLFKYVHSKQTNTKIFHKMSSRLLERLANPLQIRVLGQSSAQNVLVMLCCLLYHRHL